jgi:cobalt-zinc-cadmium resistance protein CzcA
VLEGQVRTPLVIRGEERQRASAADLARVPIVLPGGGTIELGQVAKIKVEDGPIQVIREEGQRFATVLANVRGRDLVGFVDDAKAAATRIDLPKGYSLVWGGQFENQQRAAARLSIVIPIALGAIFLLLYLTFGSLRQALLVFCNVPFATIGGVIALWASGEFLSVPASVGFIALMGIAVLNGVVLISYINEVCARRTLPFREAVMEGARRRLRPVTLTASIAALGLVPFLFADGPGAEIQRPLAIVLIGGLITATALTLLLVPVLYDRLALPRAERRRLADLEEAPLAGQATMAVAADATPLAHQNAPDKAHPPGALAAVSDAPGLRHIGQ